MSCSNTSSKLSVTSYGDVDGNQVNLYTVEFEGQLKATLTNYGGIITSLYVPDKNGKMEDVVLGYDNLEGYLEETPYFGALIGRYGNRIANGIFELDGETYQLATNNGPNHLHGGLKGFDKVVWKVIETNESNDEVTIVLQYVSENGEEGYPGTLTSTVSYLITAEGVGIRYEATTDKKTVVNLTQHSYFNLSGDVEESILDHKLQIEASEFLPVDSTLIPTGEMRPVANTPFDFTEPKTIGSEINASNQQLEFGGGYDHCWVLSGGITSTEKKVAALHHEASGRYMEVFTTEPGIQFYSGNFLDGSLTGKKGKIYNFRDGLCLETQHYPDSPNQSDFPGVVLKPGQKYLTSTSYKFSTKSF